MGWLDTLQTLSQDQNQILSKEQRNVLREAINTPDEFGDYPIHIATKNKDRKIFELLMIYGANPFAKDGKGLCAIAYACNGDIIFALLHQAHDISFPWQYAPEPQYSVSMDNLLNLFARIEVKDSPRHMTPRMKRSETQGTLDQKSPRQRTFSDPPPRTMHRIGSYEVLIRTHTPPDKLPSNPALALTTSLPSEHKQVTIAPINQAWDDENEDLFIQFYANHSQSEDLFTSLTTKKSLSFYHALLLKTYQKQLAFISRFNREYHSGRKALEQSFLHAGLHRDLTGTIKLLAVPEAKRDDAKQLEAKLCQIFSAADEKKLGSYLFEESLTRSLAYGMQWLDRQSSVAVMQFIEKHWCNNEDGRTEFSDEHKLNALYFVLCMIEANRYLPIPNSEEYYNQFKDCLRKLIKSSTESIKIIIDKLIKVIELNEARPQKYAQLINYLYLKTPQRHSELIKKQDRDALIDDLNLASIEYYLHYDFDQTITYPKGDNKTETLYTQRQNQLSQKIIKEINDKTTNKEKSKVFNYYTCIIDSLVKSPLPNYDQALNIFCILNDHKIVDERNNPRNDAIVKLMKKKSLYNYYEQLFTVVGRFALIKDAQKDKKCIPATMILKQELFHAIEKTKFDRDTHLGKLLYQISQVKCALSEHVFVPFMQTPLFTPAPPEPTLTTQIDLVITDDILDRPTTKAVLTRPPSITLKEQAKQDQLEESTQSKKKGSKISRFTGMFSPRNT